MERIGRTVGLFKNSNDLTNAVFLPSMQGRLAYFLWRYAENPKRTYLARRVLASADGDVQAIGDRLSETGIEIGDAGQFLTGDGRDALKRSTEKIYDIINTDEIQSIIQAGKNDSQGKDYLIHLLPEEMAHDENSPFLRFALDPKLLQIVSTYFGLVPQIHHIGSWLNFPTPEEAKMSQLWHRDPEDLKLLKVFVYLEPVGEKNGPFSFIPGTQPFGTDVSKELNHEHKRRITDEEIAVAFPPERWVKCTGDANTMIIADTVGFHRGGKVQEGRRLLITLTYTSGRPRRTRRGLAIPAVPSWATLPIQKAALEGVVGS